MNEYNFKHRDKGSNLIIKAKNMVIALTILDGLKTDPRNWKLITKENERV